MIRWVSVQRCTWTAHATTTIIDDQSCVQLYKSSNDFSTKCNSAPHSRDTTTHMGMQRPLVVVIFICFFWFYFSLAFHFVHSIISPHCLFRSNDIIACMRRARARVDGVQLLRLPQINSEKFPTYINCFVWSLLLDSSAWKIGSGNSVHRCCFNVMRVPFLFW